MIHRGNILVDIRDRLIDCLIILCNTRGVWSGNNKLLIKNHIQSVYSTDMRMGNNRPFSGFSYISKNDILFINSYCLNDTDEIDIAAYETCLTKIVDHYSTITGRDIKNDRVGLVSIDYDLDTTAYLDTTISEISGKSIIYRFRRHD